jgi:hypothetical protein
MAMGNPMTKPLAVPVRALAEIAPKLPTVKTICSGRNQNNGNTVFIAQNYGFVFRHHLPLPYYAALAQDNNHARRFEPLKTAGQQRKAGHKHNKLF